MTSPTVHPQVWIKVNAQVDAGVADLVETLNSFDGLVTLQSCQGETGRQPASVYFAFEDWRKLAEFALERIGPTLQNCPGETKIAIEAVNGSRPIARLTFSTESMHYITSALKRMIQERP